MPEEVEVPIVQETTHRIKQLPLQILLNENETVEIIIGGVVAKRITCPIGKKGRGLLQVGMEFKNNNV